MADNDQKNDEYQFADLDAITPDGGGEDQSAEGEAPPAEQPRVSIATSAVKRNGLIVVGVVFAILILYKFVGAFFTEKKDTIKPVSTKVQAAAPAPAPIPVQPQPIVAQPQVTTPTAGDEKINQKLSDLESGQQNTLSQVTAVNNQLGNVSNSMNAMNAKLAEMSGIIASLSAKVDQQARELEQITVRRVAREAHSRHALKHKGTPRLKYHLQAIIPGRAWLIATNGTTLTVREGTIIAGYGVVRLIDPSQGRVMTSSGQVIKFSQNDS